MYISQEEEEYLKERGLVLCDWCKHQPDDWAKVFLELGKYASGPWCKRGKSIRANGVLCHCSDYAPFENKGTVKEKAEQLTLF